MARSPNDDAGRLGAQRAPVPGEETTQVAIAHESDIVAARQRGREIGASVGFSSTDLTLIATAISELARNILEHAGRGVVHLKILREQGRLGIGVTVKDEGPGIADVRRALEDGYTTGRGLGLGLPGARRLMDEFQIETAVGRGTTVTARKWVG